MCKRTRTQINKQSKRIKYLEHRELKLNAEVANLSQGIDEASEQRLKQVEENLRKIREDLLRRTAEKGRADELQRL